LRFLTKEQFGLWALLSLLVSYLWLIDAGMSPSISRVLIECKDQPNAGRYGSLIQTAFLVTAAQGLLALGVGLVFAPWVSRLFQIPPDQHEIFCLLVRWQSVIAAVMFVTRMFRNLLYAHQRTDLVNYAQGGASLFGLMTLWLALRWGGGMMSILWANALSLAFVVAVTGWHCLRLQLLPAPSAWGRPLWREFKGLFVYGKDVFIVQIGSVLIMATQPVIVSRSLGLEAVAAWSVGTKAFFLLGNLLWQAFDMSGPAFSEMMVRNEHDRLRQRFTGLLVILTLLSGVAAVVYAACNSSFVAVWTGGRIVWSLGNDLLIGVWLVISVLIHTNCSFIVLTKRLTGMRYVYPLEGLAFVLLASLVTPVGGLPAMIGVSLVCSLCFSGAYGVRRINQYFQFPFFSLERRWLVPLGQMLLVLVPAALALGWLTSSLTALSRLLLNAAALGPLAAWLLYRFGIPSNLWAELLQRLRTRN